MASVQRAAAGATNLEPANRQLDLLWQPSAGAAIGNPADQNGILRGGAQTQLFAAPVGAGTSNIQQTASGKEIVAAYTGARRQTALDRFGFTPRLAKYTGTRPPSLDLDPVCRLLFRIARIPTGGSDVFDVNFGVGFGMVATGNVGFFSVTQPGFGLVGTGAGGWQIWARQALAGVQTIAVPVAFPTTDAELTDWEFRIIPGTESAAAILELYRQGELIFTESWANNRLPTYPSFPNGQRLSLVVGSGAAATLTDLLAVQSLRIMLSGSEPA